MRNISDDGHFLVDNLSLTDQDIKKSVVDSVPSIDFSERVYKLLEKELSTVVVLKMLGRNLGITTLHNRLYGIWKPSKPFQLMDIENGYFLAKFQSTVDYNKVLSQEIGGMVGKVTKLDLNTDSKARGRYALMAVYVNLGRPLISKILINGNPQRIEYENLCMVCFKCGRYGHIKENCSSNTNPPELKGDGELMEQTFSPSVAAGVEEYGPWMLVERRSRHSTLDRSKKGNISKSENISGSRFNSLAYMEANFSREDFLKENQRELKKKGKVSSLDSQERSVTDNKADICGSKKGTVGQNSGKISNVQFNGPQNNKLVKDVNQAGSKSGWASYTPLAVNQRVHLDKQQTSSNASIGQ
ncbi:hypothetical protein PVK06_035661 [Gossypium arboreum]|uniref:CCHC-type domain-containing protein n=1 Tax=Gossypium arboreum TaxID=29729 RepID=A0ABR0NHE2_GOSAR|nr:hypothetical protein PVK06_035661 [Gossypium arboreum]